MKHLLDIEARERRIYELALLIDPQAFTRQRLRLRHDAMLAAAHIVAGHPVCRHADGRVLPVLWTHMDPLPLPVLEALDV